jgi:selenocysteine-specific elongation factor
VRGLQVHGRAAEAARAGQRTAINVSGVDVAEVARGDVLCTPGAFEPTGRVDVSIEMLADVRPLKHGSRVRFHQGTSEVLGRVALSADPQYARIRLERAAVLTRGDRFILRAYSPPVTIGGGTVLDPRPPRGALRTSAAQERFARLNPLADPRAVSRAFIDERGIHGLPVSAFVSRVGLSPDAATAVINELHADGQVARVGELVVSSAALQERASALLEAVKRHHAAQPLSAGLPREEARERLFGRAAPAVFEHVLATLERESRLSARETLALPGHTMALSPEESRARDALLSTFKAAGLGPPEAKGAASAAGLDAAVSDRVLKLLVREKKLVRLDQLVFHADSLAQLKADLHARKAAGESRLDVSVFKERYGITRKYAIPLLEYLDRERVTRRVGDAREIL